MLILQNPGLSLWRWLLLSGMLAVASQGLAYSVADLELGPQQDDYPLGAYLEILEDPAGKLSIEDVTSPAWSSRFRPGQQDIPVFSFTDSAYWLRLHVKNTAHPESNWLLEQRYANTHYLDLYLPAENGRGFIERKSGLLRPVENRDMADRHMVFSLNIPRGSEKTVYLRVRNASSITLDLHLETWTAYLQANQLDNFWQGLFYGVLLIMLGYNLFLYFSTREASYLWLCLFIFFVITLRIFYDGYAPYLLNEKLLPYSQYVVPISIGLIFISLLEFTRAFLRAGATSIAVDRLSLTLIILWSGFMLMTPVFPYSFMIRAFIPLFLFSGLFVLYRGISGCYRKEPSACLFLGGWLVLLIFHFMVQFVRFGWLPSNGFTEHGVEIGIMWMLLFMSLAQADRINRLKKQASDTNTVLQENEAHYRNLLESTSAIPWEADLSCSHFSYVGPQVVDLLGFPRNKWYRDNVWKDNIHPEDRKMVIEFYATAGTTSEAREFEYRMLNARGETVWLRDHVKVITENGKPVRLQGFMFDITHRKQDEASRLLANRRFHALFEQSPFSIQILDPEGHTIQVNKAWKKLWHLEFEALENYNILQDEQMLKKGVMPYIEKGFSGQATAIPAIDYNPAESQGIADGGHISGRWIRAFIYPTRDNNGNISEVIMMHEDVSDQFYAEQQAKVSHERMTEAQRLSHIGSWELDLRNNNLEWSEEIYRIFEIDADKFTACYEIFLETIHPDDRDRVNQAYLDSVDKHQIYEIEHRLLMNDGRIKHVIEHGETEYDEEGKPLRSIGTVQDITERKRTEDAIKNIAAGVATQSSESFFELLLIQLSRTSDARYAFIGLLDDENRNINSYVFCADGKITDNFSCHLNNTPCQKVIEQGTYCCPTGIQSRFPGIEPLAEMGVDSYVGITLNNSNGRTIGIMVIMDSKPIDNTQQAIEILQIFSTRAAGELERIESERQLFETKQRLSLHIENTPLGVLELNTDFVFTTWNPAASRIFGFSEAEAIGKKPTDLIIHESFLPFVDEIWQDLLKQRGGFRSTNKNITKSGEIIICDWYNTPLVDDDGQIIGIASLVDDVTERINAQKELEQHRDRLEQLVEARTSQINEVNKELESFSYAVSHDLRAPLRAIDGFSAALIEDYDQVLDDNAQDYLARIRRNASYMSTLIDALLMLSRLGREKLTFKPTALHDIVSEIVSKYQQNHPEKNIEFRINDVPLTSCDRHMMSVALTNLLSNACKYSEKQKQPTVEFGAKNEDGTIVYYVRDNGAGFDMQFADKLFVAFQRLHSAREYEGTGIGLATVKRIISRHGGRIWAEAEKGKGATFFFTLDTENTS